MLMPMMKMQSSERKEINMKKIKVMLVFGTRPEAIKMAPLALELKKHDEFETLVCVTAQHRQMLDQVMEIFNLKADYDLDIMKDRQTLIGITCRVLEGLDEVFRKEKPDMVLVHGDTSTSFVAALAAFYNQIPVGHVEAGLRTYDKYSPFPEEMNRCLTGRITEVHFSPTVQNRENLVKEAINPDKIYFPDKSTVSIYYNTASTPFRQSKYPV